MDQGRDLGSQGPSSNMSKGFANTRPNIHHHNQQFRPPQWKYSHSGPKLPPEFFKKYQYRVDDLVQSKPDTMHTVDAIATDSNNARNQYPHILHHNASLRGRFRGKSGFYQGNRRFPNKVLINDADGNPITPQHRQVPFFPQRKPFYHNHHNNFNFRGESNNRYRYHPGNFGHRGGRKIGKLYTQLQRARQDANKLETQLNIEQSEIDRMIDDLAKEWTTKIHELQANREKLKLLRGELNYQQENQQSDEEAIGKNFIEGILAEAQRKSTERRRRYEDEMSQLSQSATTEYSDTEMTDITEFNEGPEETVPDCNKRDSQFEFMTGSEFMEYLKKYYNVANENDAVLAYYHDFGYEDDKATAEYESLHESTLQEHTDDANMDEKLAAWEADVMKHYCVEDKEKALQLYYEEFGDSDDAFQEHYRNVVHEELQNSQNL